MFSLNDLRRQRHDLLRCRSRALCVRVSLFLGVLTNTRRERMLLNIVAGATTRHLLHVARRGALIERRLRATLDSIPKSQRLF